MEHNVTETLNEREGTHGLYAEVSSVSQMMKKAMQIGVNWSYLRAEQRESLEMMANKVGRILSGNADFIDHWHDIAGYAMLIVKELENDKQPVE